MESVSKIKNIGINSVYVLNTSYLTDSYIIFTLKMESVSKITIFGLKMMVKSGIEKSILKSLREGRWLFLLHTEFVICAKLLLSMK